jgi:deazaflavin-dependent oxidoreductase (nitroreductase family)
MRQPRLVRWFFRLPVALYRFGLADQLGRSTLLLTTRGRKSGLPRTTALNYVVDGDVTYVLSGSGLSSDWLRNLQVNPQVQVQVGRRRFAAMAESITDPVEHRRILTLWAEQSMRAAPPRLVQNALRRIGFDYAASIRRHLEEDPSPPLVALPFACAAPADEADRSPRSALLGSRSSAIVGIKVVHSVIFLVESASVTVIFALGLTGGRSRWLKPALAAALAETAIFVANRGHCPLTGLAENLGAESGRVSDIFLPQWLADRIPIVFGPLLAVGLALLAWRSVLARFRRTSWRIGVS